MADIYIQGKTSPIPLVDKNELIKPIDVLAKAKWSQGTYLNRSRGVVANDMRLCTQIIKIDPNFPIQVNFSPSAEQGRWDIVSWNDTSYFDEGWQTGQATTWYPSVNLRDGSTRSPVNYIAFVLENNAKRAAPTCSISATQQVNVIDYIKNNFDALKSKLGGVIRPLICGLVTARKAVA